MKNRLNIPIGRLSRTAPSFFSVVCGYRLMIAYGLGQFYRRSTPLNSSLNDYRHLFRDTLKVPNATIAMLVDGLLEPTRDNPMEYGNVKEILQEIARLRKKEDLKRLNNEKCWPCHTPKYARKYHSVGNIYVNDRQDLFDIFSDRHTFLDFDFDTSKEIAELLPKRGRDSFLSESHHKDDISQTTWKQC